MKNIFSPGRFFLIGLMCILFSGNVNAGLIRYDVDVRNGNTIAPLGYMLFDVTLGQGSNRNIWPLLTQWELMWEGKQFSDQNSTATTNGLFKINELSLQVVADGIIVIQGSAIQCALSPDHCPYLDQPPHFTRDDAEELYFSGINNFGVPIISETDFPDEIIYTASPVENVPVPSTIWLLTCALPLLRLAKRTR